MFIIDSNSMGEVKENQRNIQERLKGDKERKYNSNKSVKNFKAYCFSMRSGHFEKAPAGWDISKEEDLHELGKS